MPPSPSGESIPEMREAPVTSTFPSDAPIGDPLTDGDRLEPSPAAAPEPANGSDHGSGPENGPDQSPGPGIGSDNGMDGYHRLQRRLILATLAATALAVPLTALCFDIPTAVSLLIGGLAGLLYIRLLARSVSRLGDERKSVGKVQLVVPVVLVLAAARIPQLEIVPALVGFLLYKPALIVQAVLDS
ncbi:MAG: ATP synthase subunit I [Cyanobacteria bacterium]|nr:ATP synthase subunit I [Cyanobacteriota bacterium]